MTTLAKSSVQRPAFLADVPACDPAAVRVAVLMGGRSAEREVSLMSGREVARALRASHFAADEVDLDPSRIDDLADRAFDVAFIALHGTFGEDGGLQERLDAMGIAYTGSGAESSRLAMDKVASKEAFQRAGIATPEWRVVSDGDGQAARDAYGALGPAVVVKPVDEGSSIAVTLAHTEDRYRKGLAEVFAIRRTALVERLIAGPELTVGVLRREGLPIIRIVPHQEFYNYDAKYFDDATEYIVDPELPAGADRTVRDLAVQAHEVLGCRDFSRVDFLLGEDGAVYVLEINTIPGFTTHSLLPKSAAGAGIDFPSLCRYIVELALARTRVRGIP